MTDGAAKPAKRDWVGQTLKGRYVVESVLGAGGMGTVYLAHDSELDRKVVVKVPNSRLVDDENFRNRFVKEIRALTKVTHPHVNKVFDAGEATDESRPGDPPTPFAVLEFLEGGSLRDRLEKSEQSPEEVVKWLDDVAKALDFVHAQGVVHRDVKPGNILFDLQGNAMLGDFGIVKALGTMGTGLTRTGATPGSPPYMGPEVGMGKEIGPAYDQYALGVLVYESLSGALPHEGTSGEVLIARKAFVDPIDLAQKAPHVPAGARGAVMRAIARDPKERYPSCAAFARALADAIPSRRRPGEDSRPSNDFRGPTDVSRPTGGGTRVPPSRTEHLIEILDVHDGQGPSQGASGGVGRTVVTSRQSDSRTSDVRRPVDLEIGADDLMGSSIELGVERERGVRAPLGPPTSSPDLWASTRMGPTGRPRDPAEVVLLHIFTLGLYHLWWVYSLFRDARAYADRRRDVRIPEAGPAMAVFVLTPLLIVALVGTASFTLHRAGSLSDGMVIGLGIAALLVALPFAIAGWLRTAGLVTQMRIASGVRREAAGNTSSDAWWALIPLVGLIVYCFMVQSRTNTYWRMESAAR